MIRQNDGGPVQSDLSFQDDIEKNPIERYAVMFEKLSRESRWLWLGLGLTIIVLLALNMIFQLLEAEPGEAAALREDAGVLSPTSLLDIGQSSIDSEEQLYISLYERVSPSVVHIAVNTSGPYEGGSGSGFVLDTSGNIATNNHVVEGAERIMVRFADDTTAEAELVGGDADSDLAVIRVDVPASRLKPAELGDSTVLRVGQRAIALGNPFGLEQTMTTGIISALGRVLRQESGFSLPELIQTDAAINPGNSGGPLLDSQGRVIGVTTLIFSNSGTNAGVGFAVPVNTVKRVVPSLVSAGRYADPWVGIEGQTVTSSLAETMSLPVERGVLVQNVVKGGPADKAGLRGSSRQNELQGELLATEGDIIVGIDGSAVHSMDDLIVYLADTSVGQTVTLTILRNGDELNVDVTLGERPER